MTSLHLLTEKTCCACQQTLPIAEFASKNPRTGLRQARCRTCQKEASRAHYLANKEKIIARTRESSSRQTERLAAIVAQALSEACCSTCGSKENLTFKLNKGAPGSRVSAVVHGGLSEQSLRVAMENSFVLCKHCEWQLDAMPLIERTEAIKRGEAPVKSTVTAAEYKRRHTHTPDDLRRQRFERGAARAQGVAL